MIPSAREMADAIRANTAKLVEAEILDPISYGASGRLVTDLMRQNGPGWKISVPRTDPFSFNLIMTEKGVVYRPVVSVDRIVTTSIEEGIFSQLDISLQMSCLDNKNHARWHFDRANEHGESFQDGPLYHLQFGGHMPDQPEDFWLKPPRWAHAPMDLILLLEAVAANFYTDKWTNKIRKDPTWCEYVSQSERMCLSGHIEKLQELLNVRSNTVLSGLWANV